LSNASLVALPKHAEFNEFLLGLGARESLDPVCAPRSRTGTSAVTGFIEANYAGDRCLLLSMALAFDEENIASGSLLNKS
jgi:hypothetical protein